MSHHILDHEDKSKITVQPEAETTEQSEDRQSGGRYGSDRVQSFPRINADGSHPVFDGADR
jgi:hypothetical protein